MSSTSGQNVTGHSHLVKHQAQPVDTSTATKNPDSQRRVEKRICDAPRQELVCPEVLVGPIMYSLPSSILIRCLCSIIRAGARIEVFNSTTLGQERSTEALLVLILEEKSSAKFPESLIS
ncbi:hypothetical protein Nepgr_016161 [Nepenthes gracilis]|uniref:Uncharacterized protein n=1 Tax=Nepenthes gracilis TaxID=150966 RepID=A0AAD3SP65_NEPGR|nr:hypothetical protein Nepgr_016161 [Nepenthes gracilis]